VTSAGKLNYEYIIHVAGINMFWVATDFSVSQSVINAMRIVNEKGFKSVAFPLIGSGSGNRGKEWSLEIMKRTFKTMESEATVKIVRYKQN